MLACVSHGAVLVLHPGPAPWSSGAAEPAFNFCQGEMLWEVIKKGEAISQQCVSYSI